MGLDESTNMYAKISFLVRGVNRATIKQSMDSKFLGYEHTYSLNKDSLQNISIRLKVKEAKFKWIRSKQMRKYILQ